MLEVEDGRGRLSLGIASRKLALGLDDDGFANALARRGFSRSRLGRSELRRSDLSRDVLRRSGGCMLLVGGHGK